MRGVLDGFLTVDGVFVPLNITHINTVINDPEFFGLTGDYIVSVYDKYNENMPLEGEARREILVGLIEKGWMRVNYDVHFDRFRINAWEYDNINAFKALHVFAVNLHSGCFQLRLQYSDVFIHYLSDGSLRSTSIEKLIKQDYCFEEIGVRRTDKVDLF